MSTTPVNPPAISDALNRLWAKFLPEIEHRLALIEATVGPLSEGSLADATRQAAHDAAHKLAGSLGTFGLHPGTDLARKAEQLLIEGVSASDAPNLAAWAAELRTLIQNRA